MIINILASALGFFLGAKLLSGVKEHNFVVSLFIAIIVAILSVTLGSFLKIITLGLLAHGLFVLFLDAILILIADWFVKDFEVKNFWWALALAFIVSLVESAVRYLL
ncbi:MAG: phage holin family protein [Saprospiraceae bacterium]|nr:phage holin family protein [Saprospiraceae bacterium]